MSELVFVKLGGSLITDKSTPRTARRDVIRRLGAARPTVQRERERHAAPSMAVRTRVANSPASSAAFTFITASPTEPSRPSTFTSLR